MAKKILQKGEPAPVKVIRPKKPRGQCVIICDHASNRVPKTLKNLGLSKRDLQKHIAWDPGTADIGLFMQRALATSLVLAGYSRLVVDLNRGHDNKDCIRPISDGLRIPANRSLSKAQKKLRLDEFFWPYHDTVERELAAFLKKGRVPLLMSLHSFTPVMRGFRRPWHIGVMWNKSPGIAKKLIGNLRKNNPKLKIGENKPYSLKEGGLGKHSIRRHAEEKGLPYIIVEFRQDLVRTKEGARRFAKLFLESVSPILSDKKIYRKQK